MTRFLVAAAAAALACVAAAPAGAADTIPKCLYIGNEHGTGMTVCSPSVLWGDRA